MIFGQSTESSSCIILLIQWKVPMIGLCPIHVIYTLHVLYAYKPLNNCHTHCYEKDIILVRGKWIFSFWNMSCSATSKKELIEDDMTVMKVYDVPLIQPTPDGNSEWFWWCPQSSLPAHTSQVAIIRMAPQHTKLNVYTRTKFYMKSVENQCSFSWVAQIQGIMFKNLSTPQLIKTEMDAYHVTLIHV